MISRDGDVRITDEILVNSCGELVREAALSSVRAREDTRSACDFNELRRLRPNRLNLSSAKLVLSSH